MGQKISYFQFRNSFSNAEVGLGGMVRSQLFTHLDQTDERIENRATELPNMSHCSKQSQQSCYHHKSKSDGLTIVLFVDPVENVHHPTYPPNILPDPTSAIAIKLGLLSSQQPWEDEWVSTKHKSEKF
ncbi:hypothetical protein EK904_010726 [Melospiza melodia maxima]|nr:hypothetical protein EK904_010726 [Melospiza melodia maxima]